MAPPGIHMRVVSSEILGALEEMRAEMEGRKTWPVGNKVAKYKQAILSIPFKMRGQDKDGRGRQWPPRSVKYAARVMREDRGVRVWWKDVTFAQRTDGLMVRTGSLMDSLRARWSKKNGEWYVAPDNSAVNSKTGTRVKTYAYAHLLGAGHLPMRAWAVWTNKDEERILKYMTTWHSKMLKRGRRGK